MYKYRSYRCSEEPAETHHLLDQTENLPKDLPKNTGTPEVVYVSDAQLLRCPNGISKSSKTKIPL